MENQALVDLQESVDILLKEEKEGKQLYQIISKKRDYVFANRVAKLGKTIEETVINCNDDYCEWYRTGGRNIIRKHYQK